MEGIVLTNEYKRTVSTHNREFSITGSVVRKCLIETLKRNNININDAIIVLMFDGQEIYDGDYLYLHVNTQEEKEE